MIIELKCHPTYFLDVKNGIKTFEIRKNDREYKVDDILYIMEYVHQEERYTGDYTVMKVTYIFKGGSFGLSDEYIVMAIVPASITGMVDPVHYVLKKNPEVTREALLSKTRKRNIVILRQQIQVLLRLSSKDSLSKIGAVFGQDHATVKNSIHVISNLHETDKRFRCVFDSMLSDLDIPMERFLALNKPRQYETA